MLMLTAENSELGTTFTRCFTKKNAFKNSDKDKHILCYEKVKVTSLKCTCTCSYEIQKVSVSIEYTV